MTGCPHCPSTNPTPIHCEALQCIQNTPNLTLKSDTTQRISVHFKYIGSKDLDRYRKLNILGGDREPIIHFQPSSGNASN